MEFVYLGNKINDMATVLAAMIQPKKKKAELVETEIGTKVPAKQQEELIESTKKSLIGIPTPADLKAASDEEEKKKAAMKAAMLKRAQAAMAIPKG